MTDQRLKVHFPIEIVRLDYIYSNIFVPRPWQFHGWYDIGHRGHPQQYTISGRAIDVSLSPVPKATSLGSLHLATIQ